jgi:hypothetical protein
MIYNNGKLLILQSLFRDGDCAIPRKVTETVILPLRISSTMLEGVDLAIKIGQGNNRSEIVRMALANYLREIAIVNELKKRKLK